CGPGPGAENGTDSAQTRARILGTLDREGGGFVAHPWVGGALLGRGCALEGGVRSGRRLRGSDIRVDGARDTRRAREQVLLPIRRNGQLAGHEVPVPTEGDGRGERASNGGARPRRQPHLELRPVAARDPALPGPD